MGVMNKIKLGLAVVVGVPIVGAVGYAAVDDYMNGKGKVHVQAPADDTLTVFVDGEQLAELRPDGHQVLSLEQGERAIELVRGSGAKISHSVTISSGFFEALVPASKQCFAELDVYETFYGKAKPPKMPDVEDSHLDGMPIEVSSGTYFSENALPSSVQEGSKVHLMLEIPCELVGKDAEEIRVALAFTPDNMVAR